tara:strand:+ start:512 stop:1120 length:609 start_codon:yes stop_codon:yes gene_type:complete
VQVLKKSTLWVLLLLRSFKKKACLKLLPFLLILPVFKVYALPLCPIDHTEIWHQCFGSYLYDGGEMYSGEWLDNLFHGEGVFFYQNGDRYIGDFQKDIAHGMGTYSYKNGDVYVGEWIDGKRHGKGSYAHKVTELESDLYVGDFKEDKKDGVGLYTFTDGVRYYGLFRNDKMHGKGIFLYLDGKSTEVECTEGTCKESGVKE